ncbi:MAG TPA: tetratricopeptide repeat protein [Xanthobacteraceae bacterium]|jgi:Tfp pilus assembly protein PilF
MSSKLGLINLGQMFGEAVALQRQGNLRDAEKAYNRILKIAPDNFDALNLLGAVKAQQGRIGEAQRLFSAAVKVQPRAPQGWANLGQALLGLKRGAEALECLDKARALAPDDISILIQHANTLLSLGRPGDALAEFQQILTRDPRHLEARINCGLAQAALGLPEQALAEFDAALALAPGHPIVQFNRGVTLLKLGRYAEALAANDAALAALPEHPGALLNRGRALAQLNQLDAAISSYEALIARQKDHADAHFNLALTLLTRGDYRRGFAEYEWRWRRTGMPAPKNRGRLWLGEYPLARKTILLHAEQGLGDTIQFARYVPQLVAAGATVVLEVPAELKPLMAVFGGAGTIIARGETPPPFDVHCPLGSLPLALGTELATVPAPIPYLAADPTRHAKWSARIEGLRRPRVAIAWSGNASHDNDRNRSIAFGRLTPLFDAPAAFVSVQRDLRNSDAAALAGENRVTNIGSELDDFSDTAAVLALCDLVIAVDTAVVHLAGAMGRPVWVLVPFAPDWRWGLTGETTPWYPTARLFRQTSPGYWDSVIARAAAELKRFSAPAV